jgi:hypothetical protein
MKKTSLLCFLCSLLFVSLLAAPAFAADDSNLRVTVTNAPVVSATLPVTNYSGTIDLGTTTPNLMGTYAYVRAEYPALGVTNNTLTTPLRYTLLTSTNNSTWRKTSPLIEAQLDMTTLSTNTATNILIPLPRDLNRYIRFEQISPAATGSTITKTNVYQLVVP